MIPLESCIWWLWVNTGSYCPTCLPRYNHIKSVGVVTGVMTLSFWSRSSSFFRSELSDSENFLVGIFVGYTAVSILRCNSPSSFPRPQHKVCYYCCKCSLVRGSSVSLSPVICATKFSSLTVISFIACTADARRIGFRSVTETNTNSMLYLFWFRELRRINLFFRFSEKALSHSYWT